MTVNNFPPVVRQLLTDNNGIDIGVRIPGYQHSDAIIPFDPERHKTYRLLAVDILRTFPRVRTVLELGSGAGNLAHHLRTLNPDLLVVTVDGNRETRFSPYIDSRYHIIARTDKPFRLADERGLSLHFELVLSFEHFEHIQAELFPIFVDNIRHHATESSLLVASAATWVYSSAEVHCNVKSADEWNRFLMECGMSRLPVSILTPENKPFNFDLEKTSELIFAVNP